MSLNPKRKHQQRQPSSAIFSPNTAPINEQSRVGKVYLPTLLQPKGSGASTRAQIAKALGRRVTRGVAGRPVKSVTDQDERQGALL